MLEFLESCWNACYFNTIVKESNWRAIPSYWITVFGTRSQRKADFILNKFMLEFQFTINIINWSVKIFHIYIKSYHFQQSQHLWLPKRPSITSSLNSDIADIRNRLNKRSKMYCSQIVAQEPCLNEPKKSFIINWDGLAWARMTWTGTSPNDVNRHEPGMKEIGQELTTNWSWTDIFIIHDIAYEWVSFRNNFYFAI